MLVPRALRPGPAASAHRTVLSLLGGRRRPEAPTGCREAAWGRGGRGLWKTQLRDNGFSMATELGEQRLPTPSAATGHVQPPCPTRRVPFQPSGGRSGKAILNSATLLTQTNASGLQNMGARSFLLWSLPPSRSPAAVVLKTYALCSIWFYPDWAIFHNVFP